MTNALQTFLQTGGTPEQLQEQLGVYMKRHPKYPNLCQFTYDQIESSSHKSDPIVKDSRGTILDENDDWRVVAWPFSRFFNLGEGCAATVDWNRSRVQEKVDGSLCIVYRYDNQWHVATKGMPDAGGTVNACGFSFAELFWRVAKAQGVDLFLKRWIALTEDYEAEYSGVTFMFELTSPYNKVVVAHKDSKLTFIGARKDGMEAPVSNFFFDLAVLNPVKEYQFDSQEDMVEFAKSIVGTEGEGFVVVDEDFNRVKVKSDNYLALSHMKEGFGPRRVLEVVRTGEASEIMAYTASFPEWAPMFTDVSGRFEGLVAELEADYEGLKGIADQKEFALKAVKTRCSSALFQLRNGRCSNVRRFLADYNVKSLLSLLGMRDIVLDFHAGV